ncbi:MAG: methylamine dehydrogenase (amicyanin) light chain [Proteobacteria bacterium]|nr:methylamine dehydrogenase (amicyanin) light chain [Pseudomonadota bacterium]
MSGRFERRAERLSRLLARRTSRRSLLGILGGVLAGQAALPLLPVARASGYPGVAPQTTGDPRDPGDPASCDYWRYCGIDGFLCACCGGTQNRCPPGTEMSPITWIGTCENPADSRAYIISYNDCCGSEVCGRCMCNRNDDDRPVVRPQRNSDINWCLGTSSRAYTCSTAVILGVALEP